MSHWEKNGKTDEWFTPPFVFAALKCRFDVDVAAPSPPTVTAVPADRFIHRDSLAVEWGDGSFVWMNPPFGGRNSLKPWLNKFFRHGNGIALTPDRTSAPWWQAAAREADSFLLVAGKIRFLRPDWTEGKSPSCGTTLFAAGPRATQALMEADRGGLGVWCSGGGAAQRLIIGGDAA